MGNILAFLKLEVCKGDPLLGFLSFVKPGPSVERVGSMVIECLESIFSDRTFNSIRQIVVEDFSVRSFPQDAPLLVSLPHAVFSGLGRLSSAVVECPRHTICP